MGLQNLMYYKMIILRQGNSKAERGGGVLNVTRGYLVFCVAGCILFTHFVLSHPYFEDNMLRQGEKFAKHQKLWFKQHFFKENRNFY
jgi:hypothetical protein